MLFITVYANAITIGLCELGSAGYTPTIVQFTFPRLNQIFSWLNPVAAYHRYQWRKIAKRLKHEN